jgi:drug/metabolite transporter (DMT)-like permease
MLFFNAGFGLLPVALMTWRAGGLRELRTRRIGLHMLRACCGMAGGFCAFTAYSMMPLADAYAFIFATPLLITVLSVPMLGETVRWRRWSAVLVGFAGVLIMLQPGGGSFDIGAGAALLAASASALSIILVRKLSATETTASIAFYTNAAALVVMAFLLPIGFVPPTLADLALMALAGLAGGTALMFLIAGYRRAQAAVVAPFQYSQMLWGVLLGWLLWGDLPSTAVAIGATVVVASGLYILYREVVRAEGRVEPVPVTASPAAPVAAASVEPA